MSRLDCDIATGGRRAGFAAVLLVLMSIGGCASSGGSSASPGKTAAGAAADGGGPQQAAPPAVVEVEAQVGFTITETVSLSGDHRGAYREALNLLARDEPARGIALLVEITGQVPQATAPHIDLGIAYGRQGELDKAVASFRRALTATPDHPVAHNELGIVYRKLGRFADARSSYERALSIYPGFHYARRNLAVLCDLFLADLACALEHYEIYRQTVADDREVDMWIGDIRNRMAPAG